MHNIEQSLNIMQIFSMIIEPRHDQNLSSHLPNRSDTKRERWSKALKLGFRK